MTPEEQASYQELLEKATDTFTTWINEKVEYGDDSPEAAAAYDVYLRAAEQLAAFVIWFSCYIDLKVQA